MSDSQPINVAAIEARQGQVIGEKMLARQVMSADRQIEDADIAFNPAAAARQQARLARFRPLESRSGKTESEARKRVSEIETKADEDLAQQYNNQNSELPKERLREIRSSLRQNATAEEVLNIVLAAFQDPTLSDEVLEYLAAATQGTLQDSVREARELLHIQKRREIVAGRNIDPAAKYYHSKGAGKSPTELRDLYRDITGHPREHNVLFEELASRYEFDDLKLVVSFLLKGLGFDLKSKGPSIQGAELMRLLTDVRNLQSILWVYLFFKGRLRMVKKLLAKSGHLKGKNVKFELLAKTYIKLIDERFLSLLKINQIVEKLDMTEIESKIVILSQFRDAARELSLRLYKHPKQRQELLLLLIETLEELEDKLEKQEESDNEPL